MAAKRPTWRFIGICLLGAASAVAWCFSDIPVGNPADGATPSSVQPANAAALSVSPINALIAGDQWLGGRAPVPQSLRGKVILVNFWTYSCINSLRPLPYLRDWARKYKDDGLVVIGVHTPEFGFEKDVAKVRRAVAELGISYPVKLDSAYATWTRFGNDGWPGFYIIDARRRIRDHHIGEGGYEASERLIQQLLSERNGAPVKAGLTGDLGTGIEASPDWASLGSPETYIGYRQAHRLAAPQRIEADGSKHYEPSAAIASNEWNFIGNWTVGAESARTDAPSAGIRYRFRARDLHMVLGARADGKPVRFRVTLDGRPPAADHGVDVDAEGFGRVTEDRLYQLVRQSASVRDATFEIRFLDAGARAYTFTFG
ncbi:thiol-disulfide isomerase/thioredoxin [Sphingomonas leidyi]|uniref:Thiol-disulfide isomerase/thioredoxin n=1 Tax=Sphingomonas leidyi TaxID=68569 RepID=A0A7X5UXY5_9SPHN|nr:redoxin family protein [Sphingomonas leidyi]NIJ64208.1 thiol-disulfide isomerase/thioredoxin [Sphingomonas leidyi]